MQRFGQEPFFIFFWRHTVFFFEGAEETGVILEAAHQTGFADFPVAKNRVPAHGKPLFRNIAVNRKTKIFFEHMGNVIFADIKLFCQTV